MLLNRNKRKGFTLFELLICLAIIGIMVGVMLAVLGPFGHRRKLELAAVKLVGDLRQAHQFSRVIRDGYRYYGLRFYGSLGEDSDRIGYEIVRYEPSAGEPIDMPPPVDFGNVAVIRSSVEADGPEFLEDTFFGRGVTIDNNSEFKVNPGPAELHSIVFTPEGAATEGGDLENLLTGANDEIILNLDGRTKTIRIIPLTGHMEIE